MSNSLFQLEQANKLAMILNKLPADECIKIIAKIKSAFP
jgi:hypothetical protein